VKYPLRSLLLDEHLPTTGQPCKGVPTHTHTHTHTLTSLTLFLEQHTMDTVQEPSKFNTHSMCNIFTPSITVAGVIKHTTSNHSPPYELYSTAAWNQFDSMSRHKHVRISCTILHCNSICFEFCESTVMEYRVINLPFIKDLPSAIGSYSFCCYIR